MAVSILIYWCNLIIWLVPPFRQYGGKYFRYFLVLALIDPIALFSSSYLYTHPVKVFIILSYCLLLSLSDIASIRKRSLLCTGGLVIIVLLAWKMDLKISTFGILCLHFLIISIIIKKFMIELGTNRSINLFLVALAFYEITIMVKVFAGLSKPVHYIIYYYATTGFELFLAIFFILFKPDNRRVIFKLSGEHKSETAPGS